MSEDKKSETNKKDMEIEVLEMEDFDEDDDFLSDEDELDIATLEDEDFSEEIEDEVEAVSSSEDTGAVFLDDEEDDVDDFEDEVVPLTAEKATDFDLDGDDYPTVEKQDTSNGGGAFGKFAASLLLLGGVGAGGYYVYNMPQVQEKFDFQGFVDMASQQLNSTTTATPTNPVVEPAETFAATEEDPAYNEDVISTPPMPEVFSNETEQEAADVEGFEIAKTDISNEELPLPVWEQDDAQDVTSMSSNQPLDQSQVYDPIFNDGSVAETRTLPDNLIDLNSNLASPDFGDGVKQPEPEMAYVPEVEPVEIVETPVAEMEDMVEPVSVIAEEAAEALTESAPVELEMASVSTEPELVEELEAAPENYFQDSKNVNEVASQNDIVEAVVGESVVDANEEQEPEPVALVSAPAPIPAAVEIAEPSVVEPLQIAANIKSEVAETMSVRPVAKPANTNIIKASAEEQPKEYFEHKPTVSYGNVQGGLKRLDPSKDTASKFVVVKKSSEAEGIESVLMAAKRAMKLHRYDAALEFYNDLYVKNKRDMRILVGRAVALQKSGRIDAAAQAYEEILQIDPNNTEVIVNMLGLIREGNPATALQRLLNLKKKHPTNPDLLAQLGVTHADLGNYREAIQALSMASSLEPRNAKHIYNMAVIAERMKDTDAAVKYYEKALEVDAVYGDGSALSRDVVYTRLQKLRRM